MYSPHNSYFTLGGLWDKGMENKWFCEKFGVTTLHRSPSPKYAIDNGQKVMVWGDGQAELEKEVDFRGTSDLWKIIVMNIELQIISLRKWYGHVLCIFPLTRAFFII